MHWDFFKNSADFSFAEKTTGQISLNETYLTKLIGVKLLILAHTDGLLDNHIDWQRIYNWLDIDVEVDVSLLSDLSPREKMRMRRQMQGREAGYYPEAMEVLNGWLDQQEPGSARVTSPLVQACQLIGERMDLNPEEITFLHFMWLKLRHNAFSEIIKDIRLDSLAQATHLLEKALVLRSGSLRAISFDKHPLRRFSLLRRGMHCRDLQDALEADEFLELLNNVITLDADLPADIGRMEAEIDEACEMICPRFQGEVLGAESFSYVPQLQLLRDYIADALKYRRKGCNVLLFGRPGVGKTLLAGSLACWVDASLYEVPFNDHTNDILPRQLRVDRMTQGQQLLANKPNAVMLFDEMEDVFSSWRFQPGKAWLNRNLESNPLPCIWLCNDLSNVDPAYLRRFDLVLEIPVPSSEALISRRKESLKDLAVTDAFKDWLAKESWSTPALFDQLKRLARLLPKNQPLKTEKKLLEIIEQRLSAEHITLPKNWYTSNARHNHDQGASAYQLPEYSQAWLNTNPGLNRVVRQIRRLGSARLCLHGHPGTGKTAFADYLAKQLKKPLIKRSVSSLLGMYVGETEKQVAAMFAEAKRKEAILLLDEAETFLQSRLKGDLKGWEVSMVNEMLVQLESFDGIFIATSNRYEQLDTAMMRRFDLKVAFDWLEPEQLHSLLTAVFKSKPSELKALQEICPRSLSHLQVSPGNLQTALRRLNLQGRPLRLNTLLEALADEDRAQQKDKSMPIGFIHPKHPEPVHRDALRPAARRH